MWRKNKKLLYFSRFIFHFNKIEGSALNPGRRLDENSLKQVRKRNALLEVGGGSIKNSREKVDAGSLEEDSTHYTTTGTGCYRNHEHGFKTPGGQGEDNKTYQMAAAVGDMAPGVVNPSTNNTLDMPQTLEELQPIKPQLHYNINTTEITLFRLDQRRHTDSLELLLFRYFILENEGIIIAEALKLPHVARLFQSYITSWTQR
ncbi:putative voltage-activated potassium channel [Trichonephila inaurata madagascariensis]|uniref:Putative voltage-activated potassium channel n=1 Tax=Trichonephila inaurata madagascariensis TaxID=2747483 RepID=A0A8X6XZW3_9ARAC|nr:putative voltage-activated potassium channel [Trichonephila inaurata madagascariensis]